MKKKLLILAVAGLALAACSSDETVAVNNSSGNEITFRPLMTGVTRSTAGPMYGTSWATGDVINVYADFFDKSAAEGYGEHYKYFQADFTKQDGGSFTSATPYYWPAFETEDVMTFTAIYGATQFAEGCIEGYSPAAAAASQMDVMVAQKQVTAKVTPVVLNFRHALSQIVVNVKNTNANLDFDITGVRVGYVSTSGNFAFSGVTEPQEADGHTAAEELLVNANNWDELSTASATTNYDQASTKTITSTQSATALTSFNPWLLIPQDRTAFTAYTSGTQINPASADPVVNGSYIALKLTIYNYNGTARSNKLVAEQWCYWPCAFDWDPGYKYTYTVDLAGGGYQPGNVDAEEATTLEKVLSDADVIVISPSCTIDYWVTPAANNVTMP